MSAKKWYMKFCPKDWRGDDALHSCSGAARGLWMEMVCLMHGAEPYGHLVIGGRAMTTKQLSGLANMPELEVNSLLTELQLAGIFSRTRGGIIYCRRMVRDHEIASKGRKNVEKRWEKQRASNVVPNDEPTDNPTRVPSRVPISHPSTLELELESESDKEDKKPSLRSGSRPRRVASRLPEDWEPREQDLLGEAGKAAKAAGIDINREVAKFRDHWRSSSGPNATKHDWDAALRYWLNKAVDMPRGRTTAQVVPLSKISNVGWNNF